jgi:hypothetical protein
MAPSLKSPPHTQPASNPLPPPYLPPLELICRILGVRAIPGEGTSMLTVDAAGLRWLVSAIIEQQPVDESWYQETNPDVAGAIMAKDIASGREHFIRTGYFEGRLPGPLTCDESWYLRQNPDVATAVRKGEILDGKTHFSETGWREGRAGVPEHEIIAKQLLDSVRTNRL